VFSLSDGTCAEGEPITLYPVTVKDDEIVVDIS
jgi:nitrite reductase/ring-hydroxylating ferredoxin subunit